MKTKLTLSIEKNLVHSARNQARQRGESISAMFSAFIRDREERLEKQKTATVKSMIGSLKSYPIDDSKAAIRRAYASKHPR